nr:hypothetical protein K-LCC10_0167 [Kaumoebavirus]
MSLEVVFTVRDIGAFKAREDVQRIKSEEPCPKGFVVTAIIDLRKYVADDPNVLYYEVCGPLSVV